MKIIAGSRVCFLNLDLDLNLILNLNLIFKRNNP